ncbi:uncharacterized protein LOC124550971 [Schistocerca americana]|uniref:uncharacterized protein LOC124550971 n=1 Tax=Schistocerca americana TaxID=7009 RepID=UPI001F4FB552|nr:uncharacterized protein LOC124550971 [Schistocerca americana]XP_046981747.1 uncharacterized protein LOC124550971 [Schistocerca americana]
MPTLQDIVTAMASGHEGSTALEYNKGSHSTGEGDRYEERMLALVFLRCLRYGLHFQLCANNGDAGKFDDVVLVWRPEGQNEVNTLLVQLKHKTSPTAMTVHSGAWLSEATKCDFGLSMYCTSYREISETLDTNRATFALLTNACLGDSSLDILERQYVGTFPGLELLEAGGHLYKLKPNNEQVWKAVHEDISFVENFYLLCQQSSSNNIVGDICKELEELLGAGDLCETLCDSLCKSIRDWMNNQSACLTSAWSTWQALVDEYVRKEVTECRAVTTRLEYCNVENVRSYVESCNPAWLRPPGRQMAALSATKIHQALANETHIMVAVDRFRVLRHRILRCWGPYCRWLVIVDDETEDSSAILDELTNEMQSEHRSHRRFVVVSWRGSHCFSDTCRTADISGDSWNDFLNISVALNGDRYGCRLQDLVADVDALQSLLDGEPALLLALAQLSQPLRMGRELETLPAHYVPRKLVDQRVLTGEFFSTLVKIRQREKEHVKGTGSNTIIVEGKPGVGKSKMLSHVAEKIKEKVPSCWLLRVNLFKFYAVLDHSRNGVSAAEDILRWTVFNEGVLGELEYTLLRHCLLQSTQVVCLVDGFDEVCPDYVDKCLEVLPLLSPRKGKLLVTTRPEPVKLLQARMGVSPHTLEPFSESELEYFFTSHSSKGNIPAISGLNKNLRNLLRIPLFAEMFVNLSQEIDETYDIVTLYEAFFQNKFRRLYEEKWGDNFSAPGKRREVEKAQQKHEEQLMLLAASVLLHSADVPAMSPSDRGDFVKAGIVYEFSYRKPEFLHRTFAEHFLAKWCFLGYGDRSRAVAYRKAYLNGRLDFFRESFDRRAVRGRPLLEAVLEALSGGDEGEMRALLAGGFDWRQTDACGRNALHLAVARGSLPLLQRLCRRAGEGTLSAEDGLLGWTPVRYAWERKCWSAVEVLLMAGSEFSHLGVVKAGQHDPVQLQAAFEQGGCRALYQHILEVKRRVQNDTYICMMREELEFAVNLMYEDIPRQCLSLIAEKAWEQGHVWVPIFIDPHNFRTVGVLRYLREKRGNGSYSSSSLCRATDVADGCTTPLPEDQVGSPAGSSGCGQAAKWHEHWLDSDEGTRSAAMEYKKGALTTEFGALYEKRVLALVLLRCLRRGLLFQLSPNNRDAGRFDDVVLVWRREEHSEAHALLVQVKHKSSGRKTIPSRMWLTLSPRPDFSLSKYCTSFREISKSLVKGRVTCVLLTNACLDDSSHSMFQRQDVGSVPGLELLEAGGDLYRLNPKNEQVWKAVHEDISFVENFYLLCNQRDYVNILGDIYRELEHLLGAGNL